MTAATVLDEIRARADATPDQPAWIRDGDASPERRSYRELLERVDALSARLREEGLSTAQRCGLVGPQGPDFIEWALAILDAGGCFVPIPDDHQGAVLDEFAVRAKLHRLVRLEKDGSLAGIDAFSDVPPVDGAGDAAFAALRPAYLRFTSGTTSERKGVIIGHDAIVARLAAANRGLEIGPEDRVLWLLPMAHHFVVSILLYLRFGATILLPSSSLAKAVLDFATRERATVFYASPYHYHLLSKDAGEAQLDTVRLLVSTAEGLRAEVGERFQSRFGKPLRQALGIMEVGLPVIDLHGAATGGALGRVLPDYEVWLRGDDGAPVEGRSAETGGEICIRGPGLFDAYLDPWMPASELLDPDGFRTGDQGWFDADGNLHLAGRRANRINMAGMKFFCEEVEAVLDRHEAITHSRVFAKQHPQLGEIPVAEIVVEAGAEAPARKELAAFLRGALPTYKIPREFRVVDALPLTVTGKVARRSED